MADGVISIEQSHTLHHSKNEPDAPPKGPQEVGTSPLNLASSRSRDVDCQMTPSCTTGIGPSSLFLLIIVIFFFYFFFQRFFFIPLGEWEGSSPSVHSTEALNSSVRTSDITRRARPDPDALRGPTWVIIFSDWTENLLSVVESLTPHHPSLASACPLPTESWTWPLLVAYAAYMSLPLDHLPPSKDSHVCILTGQWWRWTCGRGSSSRAS
jgi:hypothetical protein